LFVGVKECPLRLKNGVPADAVCQVIPLVFQHCHTIGWVIDPVRPPDAVEPANAAVNTASAVEPENVIAESQTHCDVPAPKDVGEVDVPDGVVGAVPAVVQR
jgi:hypothetical protein